MIPDDTFQNILIDCSEFLERCRTSEGLFSISPSCDSSAYSTCFGVFLQHALNPGDTKGIDFDHVSQQLSNELRSKFNELNDHESAFNKPFLQLFSFILSANHLIGLQNKDVFVELATATIPLNMTDYLTSIKAHKGRPQSGNLAMCMAAICYFAWQQTGKVLYKRHLEDWFNFHLTHINKAGFWGKETAQHLQFQNGFHQYEIFEAFGVLIPNEESAIRLVNSLRDRHGFFAPYPGGGGCYDYDAASIISRHVKEPKGWVGDTLTFLASSIIATQTKDFGFSDTKMIRPLTPAVIAAWTLHCFDRRPSVFVERFRYMLALCRPKYSQIKNHWSDTPRDWSESNLWDTWFRLLTLVKVQLFFGATLDHEKRFIGYPGIGVHGKVADI